jgi:orotidine-5'-phosphate decarboxylase
MTVLERLRRRVAALGAPLGLGIDPHPDRLPPGLPSGVAGLEAFARGLLEATAAEVVAVKINVAFFEAFGAPGVSALARVRAEVPADVVCILDAKRGDIGSTAERYATAVFGALAADAVTVSPYLGEDAVEPFLAWPDRVVYVLARTSNPSASRFQDLPVDGHPLHHHVARWAADRWPDGRVGLVVGATAPAELLRLRSLVPGPGFLVPGLGAQGGDAAIAARTVSGTTAPGVVSVSRGIAEASAGDDWRTAAGDAARRLRGLLREAVLHSASTATPAADSGGS